MDDIGLTIDELAAQLPLQQFIPITDAAKILGGGSRRINALMNAVLTNQLACWSHSTEESALSTTIRGETKREPDLMPDTDPATVMLDSDDVLRCWCGELEKMINRVSGKELAPYIDARMAALNARAIELKTASSPAPAVAQEPTQPPPVWTVNAPKRKSFTRSFFEKI